jgi:hypothetical protein
MLHKEARVGGEVEAWTEREVKTDVKERLDVTGVNLRLRR